MYGVCVEFCVVFVAFVFSRDVMWLGRLGMRMGVCVDASSSRLTGLLGSSGDGGNVQVVSLRCLCNAFDVSGAMLPHANTVRGEGGYCNTQRGRARVGCD